MIYAIRAGDTQYVKVGFTTGTAESRLVSMQTGNHEELIIIGEWPGGRQHEMAIHRALSAYRHRGEWFRLPESRFTNLSEEIGQITRREALIKSIFARGERLHGRRRPLLTSRV